MPCNNQYNNGYNPLISWLSERSQSQKSQDILCNSIFRKCPIEKRKSICACRGWLGGDVMKKLGVLVNMYKVSLQCAEIF